MINEDIVNLLEKKILELSSDLLKYQAELQELRQQLQGLQQQSAYYPKEQITPIPSFPAAEAAPAPTPITAVNAPEPVKEIILETKIGVFNLEQDKIPEVIPPVAKTETIENPVYEYAHPQKTVAPAYSRPVPPPRPPRKKNETWAKLEEQFAENWTGILGSVIMVIGVGFLGIYAALKLSAMGRFSLITCFAAVLGGLFFYLQKKEQWLKMALWLRSSAGAIFLFACVGANGIPGLQWAGNNTVALLVLFLGIAVNLFLGYICGKQSFASLHVLLSLVSIIIIPISPLTLIVGGVVTLFGVALTYREKWDYHLLFTISCFAVFHLFYWNSIQPNISQNERIIGIFTILIIGLAVALVHYREAYATKKFERVPFTVHLVNWFYFGLGLFLYSNGNKFATFFLAAGSIAAFILARKAKRLDIRWLYLTDTLIAQLVAIIALATLARWNVDNLFILSATFAEGLLFLFMAQKEKDHLLYKTGTITLDLTGIILLAYSLITLDYTNQPLIIRHTISLILSSALGLAYLIHSNLYNEMDVSGLFNNMNVKVKEKTKHPILACVLGGILISYFIHVFHYNWGVYSVVTLLVAILFLRNKIQSVELAFISVLLLVGTHIINWSQLYTYQNEHSTLIVLGLPVLAASFSSIRWSFVQQISKYFNWPGIYLFAVQLTLLSYYLLRPVSILAPGGAWLILSVMAITLAKILLKSTKNFHQAERYILHTGYVLIGLFLIRDFQYHLSANELWGPLKGRIWMDLFAVLVFTYWGITKKQESARTKSWKYLHPLFLELILAFAVFHIALELNNTYLPSAWISIAIITFIVAIWKHHTIGRLHVYSFGLFVVSVIHELVLYKSNIGNTTNALTFSDKPFLFACAFIVLAFSYLVFFYKYANLKTIGWPRLLDFMESITEVLAKSAAFIGIYLLGGFLLWISYLMFAPISVIIPGVLWILLSVVAVTLSITSQNKPSLFTGVGLYLQQMGYIFIVSFLIRHFLVHLQLESFIGPFKIRLLIELLAIAVFLYWATIKSKTYTNKSWDYLHPLFKELIVGFVIFIVAMEIDAIWQPIIWIAMAFVLAWMGNRKKIGLPRFLFYSLLMYWLAAIQTTFITSSYMVPSPKLWNQPWVYGTASVLFQFAFLVYFYMKCSLENTELPNALLFLRKSINKVHKRRNVYVFYPLIICTAIFLFWTFDRSLLTLLWVVECAIVFILSILLKEQHFRYIALGSLAICIIRLIFYDMAQASTLNRALVFLGVGIIMLGMNSAYNRYKGRFK
jgi:hypothetical protein